MLQSLLQHRPIRDAPTWQWVTLSGSVMALGAGTLLLVRKPSWAAISAAAALALGAGAGLAMGAAGWMLPLAGPTVAALGLIPATLLLRSQLPAFPDPPPDPGTDP